MPLQTAWRSAYCHSTAQQSTCLADLGLCAGGCAAKLVKANVKPLVDGLREVSGQGQKQQQGGSTAPHLGGQAAAHSQPQDSMQRSQKQSLPACLPGEASPPCVWSPAHPAYPTHPATTLPTLWIAWYLSQICWQVSPSSRALVSVAVPYSSVPHTYTVL